MNPTINPIGKSSPPPLLGRSDLRQGVKLCLDGGIALFSWLFSQQLFSTPGTPSLAAWKWVLIAMGINLIFKLTLQHYRLIGFRDALRLSLATLALLAVGVLWHFLRSLNGPVFNIDTTIAAALTTGGLWSIFRGMHRVYNELASDNAIQNEKGTIRHRTLVVGAGRAGVMTSEELKRHPELGCHVIGFIDDAPDKQGVRIQGTPMLGTSEMLSALIREYRITQVVLAIPSAPGTILRHLSGIIKEAGASIKTVPGIYNLLGSRTWKPELKDISIDDLLRRAPVALDQAGLQLILEDSVVLITGGGGSIGGELARQVAAFRPGRIILLGHGENSLWQQERALRSEFPNQSLTLELCDIRNPRRLRQAFGKWRPQVVLHAAAHKHVPYLEQHPEEAVENNVLGTLNVLQAALAVGAHTFVNISTDKAINPTNVLGATKRIAESLVLQSSQRAPEGARYVSVRFGNVLGSRGSVIPIFQEQLRTGGPLTVTHPDMTRYFMTIPEASQLALQAGILGETGKVYVLDMGEPVRIMDLANDMARLNEMTIGLDIEIEFIGIRPGEKFFEEMFSSQEDRRSDAHPKVFNASVIEPAADRLAQGMDALRNAVEEPEGTRQAHILYWLKTLVPTYTPSPAGLGRYGNQPQDRRASGANPTYKAGPS